MAFFDCHFFSDALAMNVSAYVIIPQPAKNQIGLASAAASGSCQTLYLLHGLSDDHTIWLRRTSIERYAAAKNLAVVMPAVARSFYHDMASGPKYWSFVSEELPRLMRRFFPLSAAREETFVAGLSMGGYGALRLALECSGQFAAAASFSGALDLQRRLDDVGKRDSRVAPAEWQSIVGADLQLRAGDLYALAEAAARSESRPALWIDCGTEDELLGDSRNFHAHLDALGYTHHYEERPGAHEWAYWDGQIRRVLDWLPLRK
jgi:putative tributyrin esterase